MLETRGPTTSLQYTPHRLSLLWHSQGFLAVFHRWLLLRLCIKFSVCRFSSCWGLCSFQVFVGWGEACCLLCLALLPPAVVSYQLVLHVLHDPGVVLWYHFEGPSASPDLKVRGSTCPGPFPVSLVDFIIACSLEVPGAPVSLPK